MNNNKYKILLVEDEANILTFVGDLLESNEYQVIKAESCTEAETLYASYLPDLVILDLGLPDRDGTQKLRTVAISDCRIATVRSFCADCGREGN